MIKFEGVRKMTQKVFWKSLVFVLVLLSPFVYSQSKTIEITIIGYGSIVDEVANAIDVAIRDAIRRGVEQTLGAYIDSYTRITNFDEIEDSILSKTTGYVSSYEIKKQWIEDGVVKVEVNMVIREGELHDDWDALALAIQRKGNPRIAIFILESQFYQLSQSVQLKIKETLIGRGLQVVDNERIDSFQLSLLKKASASDSTALSQLANFIDAELLILGTASGVYQGNFYGMISCNGIVKAQLIDLANFNVLTAQIASETGVDITQQVAMNKAFIKAGETLAERFIDALANRYLNTATNISLYVVGIDFSELQLLETKIKNTRLVKNVFIRNYNNGSAQLEVLTELSTKQLVEIINKWKDLPLKVTSISGNIINCKKDY